MTTNIFIIESPLQLINALEARHQLEPNTYSILIVLQGVSDKNLEQIESLIDKEEWQEVHVLRKTKNRWRYRKYTQHLNEIISNHKYIKSVFIGEYRSILMRHVANKCVPTNKYLLDDGNYSLFAQQKILAGKGDIDTRDVFRKIYDRMLGLQDHDLFGINFFSVYDLNINAETESRFIRNQYLRIRKLLSDKKKEDYVLFLGSNMPEMGVLSEEYYFNCLKKIKRHYSNKLIKYVPHRRESPKKIIKIKEELQFEICSPNKPVELFLLEEESLPNCLAAFFSSALDNCHHILGSRLKINSFKVSQKEIQLKEYRERTKLIYDVYMSYKDNFQIIEL